MGIRKILTNPQYAESLGREARIHAESYEWGAIASSTLGTYTRIMSEYNSGKWKPIKSMSE